MLSARATLHLVLHFAVPALLAWWFYRERFWRAFLWMQAAWVIDLDHLLADPIYAPGRCSIGFHPLHSAPAVVVYGVLTWPRRTRLFGLGLLIHVALDLLDCVLMRQMPWSFS